MITTNVLILNTNCNARFRELAESSIHHVVPSDVEVTLSFPQKWPTLIVDDVTLAQTVPQLLDQAVNADANNYDAVIVNQHSDPGIDALRELLNTRVIGLGETSIQLAASLAEAFSMVTVTHTPEDSMRGIDLRLVRKLGAETRLASYRAFGDSTILGELLTGERDKYTRSFVEECKLAVVSDGARAICLAGSVFGYWLPRLVDAIRHGLHEEGYGAVPVIEPMRAGLNMARALTDLNVRHWPVGRAPAAVLDAQS